MPVAERGWTRDELRLLEHLRDVHMIVGAPDWSARRDLVLLIDLWKRQHREAPTKYPRPMITLTQAQTLRRLGQRHAKSISPAAQRTAQSPVGTFPYTKRESAEV